MGIESNKTCHVRYLRYLINYNVLTIPNCFVSLSNGWYMVNIQITVFDRQVKPDPFPEPLGLKIKRSITSVLRKLPVEQNDYNYIHVMD